MNGNQSNLRKICNLFSCLCLCYFIVCSILCSPAQAQIAPLPPEIANEWELLEGPYGGRIAHFTIAPSNHNVFYAASSSSPAAIYKSADGGVTWFNTWVEALSNTQYLEIDHFDEDIVYAGYYLGAIFASSNGGQSWNHVDLEAILGSSEPVGISFMAADPLNPGHIFLGTQDGLVIDLNYTDSSAVILGEPDPGLGGSWISAIYPPTVDGGRMFAALRFNTNIYYSDDGGINWTLSNSVPYTASDIAVDPSNPNDVYVATNNGVYASRDNGVNFTLLGLEGYNLKTVRIHPTMPLVIYVCEANGPHEEEDDRGVLLSIDGGVNWQPMNDGIQEPSVTHIEIHPSVPDLLFASTSLRKIGHYIGFYRSGNNGRDWVPSNIGMLPRIWDLKVHPTNSRIIYAGSEYGLFKSMDKGKTWIYSGGNGMTDHRIAGTFHAIDIDPTSSDTMYVATKSWQNSGGLFKSTDGGDSWDLKIEGKGKVVTVDPVNPNRVFFATGYPANIYLSQDYGETWNQVYAGASNVESFAIHVNPADPQIVLAGIYNFILRSTDGGQTWDLANMNGHYHVRIGRIDCRPDDKDVCYATSYGFASTGGGKVLHSTDGGQSWNLYTSIYQPLDFVYDKNNHDRQYVTSARDGVSYTLDGTNWHFLNQGLDPERLGMLGIERSGKIMFANWWYGGIYSRRH